MIKTNSPRALLQYAKKNGIPFELHTTTFTKKIFIQGRSYRWTSAETDIPKKWLYFINVVKKHCEKHNPPHIDRAAINYIFAPIIKKGYTYKNCIEIDLTGAYWEVAYRLKYIDKDIYKKGLTAPKNVRLICLGNLAKRVCKMQYSGTEFLPAKFVEAGNVANIYFHISMETDLILKNLINLACEDFLYYWVDAIFVRSESAADLICKYLKTIENLPYKRKNIKKIIRRENKIWAQQENDKWKPYTFLKPNSKKDLFL
jgi:hypothetical protein